MLHQKIQKVILDTDPGTDIDDSWALGMLLNLPALQPELVLSATGDTRYRAAVNARFLHSTGHGCIPVGIGIPDTETGKYTESLHAYADSYSLSDYPGPIHEDGIQAALDIIEQNSEITLLSIAPMTNIAEICRRRPDLTGRCRLIAMAGSLEYGGRHKPGQVAEYNIISDLQAAQTVFSAPWKEFILTPLDHCGDLILSGELYEKLGRSGHPVIQEVLKCYHCWLDFFHRPSHHQEHQSTILYDTAAVALAYSRFSSLFKNLSLSIDSRGYLVELPGGRAIQVAAGWKNRGRFLQDLTEILTGNFSAAGSDADDND